MNSDRASSVCRDGWSRTEVDIFKTDDQHIAAICRDVSIDIEVVVLRDRSASEQSHVAGTRVADCLTDGQIV